MLRDAVDDAGLLGWDVAVSPRSSSELHRGDEKAQRIVFVCAAAARRRSTATGCIPGTCAHACICTRLKACAVAQLPIALLYDVRMKAAHA